MFVVANCLGGVIEAGIQVEMCFLTATLFPCKNHIRTHSLLCHIGIIL